ncbi:MAG TPA: acetyl-CoA hydrolase/transferase C-terminal domain-containing protein [Spirochaetota bacterium]|nr:acetyl-CoA hydrolase/transferase C-terminal domain-containing protein [Spirochaetota bacterium]
MNLYDKSAGIYDKTGVVTDDLARAVDDVINYVGKEINYAMTLGLGKPVRFVNELYRRAKEDPSIKLNIITALSLEKPTGKSELEKRLIDPLAERIFGGYPDFQYMIDLRAGKLPANVEIFEFYSKAGSIINIASQNRNYLPSNYTHIARDAYWHNNVNVFGQLIGCKEINGKMMYSMGCNTDICISALRLINLGKSQGKKLVCFGEVNENMPFMYGDAVVDPALYDFLLKGEQFNYRLFGAPKDAVTIKDHMIGLNISTLIKDGGTLQVGIGALGDAIVAGLDMRHSHNELYNEIIEEAGLVKRYDRMIKKYGGTGRFEKGLYGSSEMFVDAFMQLYKKGILKRRVYDNVAIMQLIEEGKLSDDRIPADILALLYDKEGIHMRLREKDVNMLVKYGIFKEGVEYKDGFIWYEGKKYERDCYDRSNLEALKTLLGDKMKNGQVILGAFFLGPESFYKELNAMSEDERSQFGMSGVETVNQLYGGEELRALQRKDGRFVNSGLVATLTGSVASDQLEDGKVVSGIGGQYNFVSMAHEVPGGKLIMAIRATRGSGKKLKSNIVYNYGHTSIPKYLRDIVVTEYGIAHIKGISDGRIAEEMIKIADSRFQPQLVREAKKHGKLPADYEIPEEYRNNYPEKVDSFIKSYQAKGLFKLFPFGTDVLPEEAVLAASLKGLKAYKELKPVRTIFKLLAEMLKSVPEKAAPYLKRMDLENPKNFSERFQQKTVIAALRLASRI